MLFRSDQAEGLAALKQFLKDTGLSKPVIVNSGRGIHAYWPLEGALPAFVWKPLAEKLKGLCAQHKLEADPAVTSDCARILRIPGTLNFKDPENPAPVEILTPLVVVDVATVQTALDKYEDIFAGMGARPHIPRGMDSLTMLLSGNSQARFKTIMLKSVEGKGCNQLLHIYENQETIEEPLWRAGLSIAQQCVDRDKAIHALSSKHPEYSPEYTEKKANETKGPYTCATFKKLNPSACLGCEHSFTSPIQLGKEIIEATEADNIVQEEPATPDEEPVQYVIPQYPYPYFRGKVGGIYINQIGRAHV